MLGQFRRQVVIKLVHIRHAAADHENVRVQRIYHERQTSRQAIDVTTPNQVSNPVSLAHFGDNGVGSQFAAEMPGVISLETEA